MEYTVDTKHSDYETNLVVWARCRDAVLGQDAVHSRGSLYLPKLMSQTTDEYNSYKLRALYYNASGRTVDGLTGLVMRKPPVVELPMALDYLVADVDTSGTTLNMFLDTIVEELLITGRTGILIDYPRLLAAQNLQQELASGARPYARIYRAEEIINWRVGRVQNKIGLTLVVLAEVDEKPDGFGVTIIQQRRVLRLNDAGVYELEVWQQDAKTQLWIQVGETMIPLAGGAPMQFLPFAIHGPAGPSVKVEKPPIKDLVDVNLSHYRTTADYEHGLHFTGLPTPVVYGHTFDDGETFALGSATVKAFSNPQTSAEFLEFSGNGLGTLSKRLEEKESMMVALGARMLAQEKRAVETAEVASIYRAGENGVLASIASSASRAATFAVEACAAWQGVAPGEVTIKLNQDYVPSGMTSDELGALVAAWQASAISYDTLYDNLRRGEIARTGVDVDEERQSIEDEPPKLGLMGEPTRSM